MQGAGQAIAFGQPECPGRKAGRQFATGAAGQTAGFGVLQSTGVLLAQAHGFRQPECLQGCQFSHASSRRLSEW
ncbi:hypothetical protein D3C86_1823430 [compost metagenome]